MIMPPPMVVLRSYCITDAPPEGAIKCLKPQSKQKSLILCGIDRGCPRIKYFLLALASRMELQYGNDIHGSIECCKDRWIDASEKRSREGSSWVLGGFLERAEV